MRGNAVFGYKIMSIAISHHKLKRQLSYCFCFNSMGYGLWVNANDKIHFPTYRRNVTLEELLEPRHASSDVNGTNYSFGDNYRDCDPVNEKLSVGEFANKIRALPFANLFSRPKKRHDCKGSTHWWSSFINDVFDIVW